MSSAKWKKSSRKRAARSVVTKDADIMAYLKSIEKICIIAQMEAEAKDMPNLILSMDLLEADLIRVNDKIAEAVTGGKVVRR